MHNIRKVKKKKKVKPVIVEENSPQQALIQISNSKEEEFNILQSDYFDRNFKQTLTRKTPPAIQTRKVLPASKNSNKLDERYWRRKSSQHQLSDSQNSSNQKKQTSKSNKVQFIYLKSPKTVNMSKQKNVRSKTVCNFEEQRRHGKTQMKQYDERINKKYLNLKEAISVSAINYAPSLTVKIMKLSSRYPVTFSAWI